LTFITKEFVFIWMSHRAKDRAKDRAKEGADAVESRTVHVVRELLIPATPYDIAKSVITVDGSPDDETRIDKVLQFLMNLGGSSELKGPETFQTNRGNVVQYIVINRHQRSE
jgi:hypothetical protein